MSEEEKREEKSKGRDEEVAKQGYKRKRKIKRKESYIKKKRYRKCLLSNASREKKDCSKNSSLFYSHLRLVFVVNICNFIPENICSFEYHSIWSMLPGTLLCAQTENAYSFTHSYCNANTDLSTQSDFANTSKQIVTHHTMPRHATLFPLISIHYSGFSCGDEREKEKKLAKSFYSHIFEYGMDVAYD